MLKNRMLYVGIGQAGSNMVREMENLGYNSFYINTSYEDLRPLDADDSIVYHIPNAKGCGKDRNKAINYAINYYGDIINEIDSKFPTCDIVMFFYSLGGGTGSGLAPVLLELITSQNPNKYYGAVAILPHESESILVHSNARESIKQLIEIQDKLCSIHLLDNNKRENFLDINQEFSQLFDRFIDFNETTQKGNIDGEELEKLAIDNGISIILEFEDDDFKMGIAKAIKESIYADWNNDCNYLGIVLQNEINKTKSLEDIYECFGMPITDFTTFSKDSNLIIATGISFNMTISKQLAALANEKLKRKQELDKNRLDDDTDDIEIDFNSIRNKNKSNINPKKKIKDNSNLTKELNNIVDKYKNMGRK